MSRNQPETGTNDRPTDFRAVAAVELQELSRRNPSAVAMDLLYLFTVAFFAHHLLRGLWPAIIGAIPLLGLMYFGWRSSVSFFIAILVTIALSLAATYAGLVPL